MLRVAIALLPLALAPVLLYLIAGGQLNFGAGEKDLIWVFPWLLWSMLFAVSSFILWHRGWSVSRSIVGSAVVGLAGLILTALLLAALGRLGVAGRF